MLFAQLPFKACKYDITVGEPGLGEAYGARIVLKAQVSRGSSICSEGSGVWDGPNAGQPRIDGEVWEFQGLQRSGHSPAGLLPSILPAACMARRLLAGIMTMLCWSTCTCAGTPARA